MHRRLETGEEMKIFLSESGRSFVVIENNKGWWFSPQGPRYSMTAEEAFDPNISNEDALKRCRVMENGGGCSLSDLFRFDREGAGIFTMPTVDEVGEMLTCLRRGDISGKRLQVEMTGPFSVEVKEFPEE